MPAILINIRIENKEKLELFKKTLSDQKGLFEEQHIKIRGAFRFECVEYAQYIFKGNTNFYQNIQEEDWVSATLEMITKVKSRSVFLYFEDHKLITTKKKFEQVIEEFDKEKIDHLCYSFYNSNQLDKNNIMPLRSRKKKSMYQFDLDKHTLKVLSKISPRFYTFSLISIVSVEYLKAILISENYKVKIHNKWIIGLISKMLGYPNYRRAVNAINIKLKKIGFGLCIYPKESPFNIEKMWFETVFLSGSSRWRMGILDEELFINYDDDNGAYCESLIKRGIYPFEDQVTENDNMNNSGVQVINLKKGELFDITYYGRKSRIISAPRVKIEVKSGQVFICCRGSKYQINKNESRLFYSNIGPIVYCSKDAETHISYYDEDF